MDYYGKSENNIDETIASDNSDESLRVDYVAIEIDRIKIGKIGEEYVMKYERTRLKNIGLEKYVCKIKQVSLESDKFGYDIKSFDYINGEVVEIFIEVKATTGECSKSVIITSNELEVSKVFKEQYRLYRVYNLDNNDTDVKILKGSLDKLNLTPDRYSANIK